MFKFGLGKEVKDIVTGFKGIIIARVEYLNGCMQYCIEPKKINKDGSMIKPPYIDEGQLKITGKGIYVKPKKTGGVMGNIPSASYKG